MAKQGNGTVVVGVILVCVLLGAYVYANPGILSTSISTAGDLASATGVLAFFGLLVAAGYGIYLVIKRPAARQKAVRRLRDRDFKLGRQGVDLAGLAILLYAISGFTLLVGFVWTASYLVPIYTYGILVATVLLVIDVLKH